MVEHSTAPIIDAVENDIPDDGAPYCTPEELKKRLLDEIRDIAENGVGKDELALIRTPVETRRIFARDSIRSQADTLGELEHNGFGWKSEDEIVRRLFKVTPEQVQSAARLLLNRLHRIRCTTDSLRRQSRRHHTLYPGLPNIAESVSPIALWQPSDAETRSGSLKTESILLGQPALPDPDANARLMSQIARHFNIPHYFPHPRETRTVGGIGYINTPLIFEDYLLRELQRQPETQFCLYHLASTAALNTAAFPHVQIRAIRPAHPLFLSPNWANLYRLMAQMGMEIVEFQAA